MSADSKTSSLWRHAACITMLSGPLQYFASPKNFKVGRQPVIQWLDGKKEEAEILFVRRHPNSRSMANVYVFPGGALDQADYSPSWMSVFSNHRQPFASILSLRDSGLPIFRVVPRDGPIMGEIAFRICAIRELFEEAGILLARSTSEVDSILHFLPGSFPPSILKLSEPVLEKWRSRVHDDAIQFIEMCKELECVPDIWSLIEWSDWLTPRYRKRRFDTLFYLCLCEQKPLTNPDEAEVSEAKWFSPSQVDLLFAESIMNFPFPQISDVRKLQAMCSIGGLPLAHLFALYQSTTRDGIMCKRSSRIRTKDGVLLVTNLDDLSPRDPEDKITHHQFPMSFELVRRGVILKLSDDDFGEYDVPNFTVSELRDMSVALNRANPANFQSLVSDTVEIKWFCDFMAKIQRTKL